MSYYTNQVISADNYALFKFRGKVARKKGQEKCDISHWNILFGNCSWLHGELKQRIVGRNCLQFTLRYFICEHSHIQLARIFTTSTLNKYQLNSSIFQCRNFISTYINIERTQFIKNIPKKKKISISNSPKITTNLQIEEILF